MINRIPKSLDTNRLDVTINLKTSDGMPIKHFNLGLIIYFFTITFVIAKIVTSPSIAQLPTIFKLLMFVSIEFVALMWLLKDDSERMLFNYAPYIIEQFKNLKTTDTTIRDIQPYADIEDDYYIKTTDGRYMVLLDITGRASTLLFPIDVVDCTNAFDSFFRSAKKIDATMYTQTFTSREPLHVDEMIDYMYSVQYPKELDRYMASRMKRLKRTSGEMYVQYMVINCATKQQVFDVLDCIQSSTFQFKILEGKEAISKLNNLLLQE